MHTKFWQTLTNLGLEGGCEDDEDEVCKGDAADEYVGHVVHVPGREKKNNIHATISADADATIASDEVYKGDAADKHVGHVVHFSIRE